MDCDPYKEYVFSERYHPIATRRGKERAFIAVEHSQLISVYLILSTGIRYHELNNLDQRPTFTGIIIVRQ